MVPQEGLPQTQATWVNGCEPFPAMVGQIPSPYHCMGSKALLITRRGRKPSKRVSIIGCDRLLFDGRLVDLRLRFGGKRELLVDFVEAYEDVAVEGATVIEWDGLRVTYQFERNGTSVSTLIGRISSQFRIRDLEVRDTEIEETIRRIYEQRLLEE